ncbi:MAG: DUF4345 domain-containing protein [Bacteroidota bacterium]
MTQYFFIKNLHLLSSAIIIITVGLIYGLHPSLILPRLFDFEVENTHLKNIFRAIMGLYLAMGGLWLMGIKKSEFWRAVTLTNVVFVGGLAFGRIVSTIFDGFSLQFTIGLVAELLLMIWGIYNLKKFD